MFEYSADKPFSKMESEKSIDTLLKVSQVSFYCSVYIDPMAVSFRSTFILSIVNEEMTLVWNKSSD